MSILPTVGPLVDASVALRRSSDLRAAMRTLACLVVCAPLLLQPGAIWAAPENVLPRTEPLVAGSLLSREDEQLLDDIERASSRFFWEATSPETGLVKDRTLATGNDGRKVASIAATGFGLTGLCIAHKRQYLPAPAVTERVLTTLRFLAERMPHERGFFYHFIDVETGQRVWECEISSIDSAILLCGVLTCRQYFTNEAIRTYATRIYDRVEWPWLVAEDKLILHGWKPESGFLKWRWDNYSEHMMIYLLALGSRQHAISAESWHAWQRPWSEYAQLRFIHSPAPLFVHQYSHAWFDFQGRRDRYADYFENSVVATKVHRLFCLGLRTQYPHFGEDLWGITASDSIGGYVAWGGPPATGPIDGTIVPAAAGGSVPFLPAESLRVLRTIRARYRDQVWKRYGFVDAFNPAKPWYAPDVIGINVGVQMLMAENTRSRFIWEVFMANPEIRAAMQRAGFEPAGTKAVPVLADTVPTGTRAR